MKRSKYILITLMMMFGFVTALAPATVGASASSDEACKLDPKSALCTGDPDAVPKFIKTLVNGLLFVLGAVSIVVIIFAGIFYTTSIGDSAMITKAKNTLLYAVIGLIVAISAYAIVNFILATFK